MPDKIESWYWGEWLPAFDAAALNGLTSGTYLSNRTGDLSTTLDISNPYNLPIIQLEMVFGWGGTPVAGKTVDIWVLPWLDGNNFGSGGAATVPARTCDYSLKHNGTNTAHRTVDQLRTQNSRYLRLLLFNNLIAQTPSGSSIRYRLGGRKVVNAP